MILSDGNLSFPAQALGEVTPSLSNGYFYARDGLSLSGKFETYAALYRVQPSISALVDKVGAAAARLTLRTWDYTPASGKVEDVDSPFAKLIAKPCEFLSPFSFWRWTVSTYEIYGEAFWYKVRNPKTGEVVSLVPMHPSKVQVKRAEDGSTFYIFTLGVGSAGILVAPAEDVVPFLRYNPDGLMRGMSRLEPLRTTLLSEDAARRATASWWRNGARPSVVIEHPKELSEGAARRILTGFNAAHAGADNMGSAAVLEEGMKANIVQLNAEEMQYIETRKLNMQEACMVYDVPPPVVHILDHATFSNITEQMRSMYRDTMAPRLEDIESVIDFYLRSDFYPDASHCAAFDLDEVLRGDFETRGTAIGNLIEKGVFKPSEARPLFNLPEAGPEADKLYGNAALVPLGSSVHGQQEVGPGGSLIPSEAPMGLPKPIAAPAPAKSFTQKAIGSRVGRKGTLADKRAALVDEHRQALGGYFAKQAAGGGSDDELAGLLVDLGTVTARAIGSAVAKQLGGDFDAEEVAGWIEANAVTSAKSINATTADQLKAYLDEPDADPTEFWNGPMSSRADSISVSRVAAVAGLATQTAGEQNGAASKTWVTGPNPRPEHARMDGETVPLSENFSNGMAWPGDAAGGADEIAGCNCDLQLNT